MKRTRSTKTGANLIQVLFQFIPTQTTVTMSSNGSPSFSPKDLEVGTANAWSYFYGYLQVLLGGKPITERLKEAAAGRRFIPRLFLLCPLDGQLVSSAEDLDSRLKPAGKAAPVIADVAGARGRPYGPHPLFQLEVDSGEPVLMAVESVASARTARVVSEAMAASQREMPKLTARRVVQDLVDALGGIIAQEPTLRGSVQLIAYTSPRDAFAQLREAARTFTLGGPAVTGDAIVTRSPTPPLPLGVGAYLAWSFMHGYLLLAAKKRDVPAELAALSKDTKKRVPIRRIVIVCPLSLPAGRKHTLPESLTDLDADVEPVHDVNGVEAGVTALKGRQYGAFSLYKSRSSGDNHALELATPLRTLALGVSTEGRSASVYSREAKAFVKELKLLLEEQPTVAAHYTLVAVDDETPLHQALELAQN